MALAAIRGGSRALDIARGGLKLEAMAPRAFPVIYSHSVAAAATFYVRLGFQQTFRLPPEGEPGYVSLRRGDAELGIEIDRPRCRTPINEDSSQPMRGVMLWVCWPPAR